MEPAPPAQALIVPGLFLAASTSSLRYFQGLLGLTEITSGDPPTMKKSQTFIRLSQPPWTAAVTQDSETPARVYPSLGCENA